MSAIALPALDRRRFILAMSAAALAIAAPTSAEELSQVLRKASALGAKASILVLHSDKSVAEKAADWAIAELARVDELMSLYRPTSQICRLNRDGLLDEPHPYMVEVLRVAADYSRRTDGAFDVTVQPLWELYVAAKKRGTVPDEAAVREAKAKVDWRKVEIAPNRIAFKSAGMAITLNALAQGYALDRALAVLRGAGIEHALVDAGEVGVLGRKADGSAWTAGIQHPRHADAYIAVAKLDGRCMATSGDYATRFTDDRVYHHIFDPSTGRSPRELASATVVAPRGIDADALSTAVMVMGRERGIKLVESIERADALLVLKDGRVIATRGFPTT